MWLRRSKSKVRAPDAPSPQFGCSSFKDVQTLVDEAGVRSGDLESTASPPKRSSSICHRVRRVNTLSRSQSNSSLALSDSSPSDEIRIHGAERSVVVYFTSLRVVRRTFEDCNAVRCILNGCRVMVDERDILMDSRFMNELQRIIGKSADSIVTLPRVFIGGRYIGGVEEVQRLYETGELKKYVEGLEEKVPGTCEVCGGHRFILCPDCSGGQKCYREKTGGFRTCTSCNENGLVRCPTCAPELLPI